MTSRVVEDNPVASRYELHLDGELSGWVDYQLDGEVMTIPHVEVASRLRGQGVSAPFLDEVLVDIRRRGLKIVPLCGYARGHVASRPDLHDLLA